MQRHHMPVRPALPDIAREHGFDFHIIDDEIYWDESRAYRFTLRQIEEQIEAPTNELHQMCLEIVDAAVRDEETLHKLGIAPLYHDAIAQSWHLRDPSLYGRMDFAWTGSGPVKLLEYNADTPTSLYESAWFQWVWLRQMCDAGVLPPDADQYNSIQEKLIARFATLCSADPLYFCCCYDSTEDRGTVRYLEDCARQAGLPTRFIHMEDIGLGVGGLLTDEQDNVMRHIFKLYPLEWMMRDDNGPLLQRRRQRWLEPLWKSILSNKGLLPLLWQRFPGHPNLLPAWFASDISRARVSAQQALAGYQGYVRKPLFSREGGNVAMFSLDGSVLAQTDGEYGEEPTIFQAMQALPRFDESYTLLGSWVIGDEAAGIGIREDNSLITKDTSRFVPHYIVD